MALGKKKKRKMGRAEPNVEIRKAQSLKKRKKTRRAIMAGLAVVALLAVVFFIWARAQGRLSVTENAVGSAFTPIVSAVNRSMEWIRDVFRDIGDREALRRENEQLKLDNDRLSYQLSQLEAVSGENQRLLSMLDAWDNYETLDPVFARVVARDPGLWFDVFTINAGTSAGVEVNMAVVTGDGLVGRVYEAGLNYAKVMTIIDTRSSVATLIERTRGSGMMRASTRMTTAIASITNALVLFFAFCFSIRTLPLIFFRFSLIRTRSYHNIHYDSSKVSIECQAIRH